MPPEEWFDTEQNNALLAICTRQSIKRIGIAGVVWGCINLLLGVVAVSQNILNVGLVMLALLVILSGVYALVRRTLGAILFAAIVCVLLVLWNIGVTILNVVLADQSPAGIVGIIIVIAVAFFFFKQYSRLRPLRKVIASLNSEEIRRAKELTRSIMKAKLKENPDIVLATQKSFWGRGKCRIRLMEQQAFFTKRNLSHAFVMPKEAMRSAIPDLTSGKFKFVVNHPVEKISYRIGKKDTEKIRNWLSTTEPTDEARETVDAGPLPDGGGKKTKRPYS